MADGTFSSPGAPNLRTSGGRKIPVPEFFPKTKIPDDQVSISTVATPRELAMSKDAADSNTKSGAPKV